MRRASGWAWKKLQMTSLALIEVVVLPTVATGNTPGGPPGQV